MKQSRTFTMSTPIVDKYSNNKVLGYARIEGVGYMYSQYLEDWRNKECELEDVCGFDINDVIAMVDGKEQNITMAYRIDKQLGGHLSDTIDEPTLAHMEYLFRDVLEAKPVDLADCAMCAINHEANKQAFEKYTVIATAENKDNITLVTPEKAA